MRNLFDIPIENIDGKICTLKPYLGKVLLIVNVASRCGFTKQYAMLEQLYQDYRDRGFVVLGFPCNQFGRQEPGSNSEIKGFASECYRVSFPLFAKIEVKGEARSPLYAHLQANMEKKPWMFIPWNFSKILVDANGQVRRQYAPTTGLAKLRKAIEPLLPKAALQK